MGIKKVERHYDECEWQYEYLWSDSKSLGLHHGLWERGTRTKQQALINPYKHILKFIKKGDKVLDAGCGVGGASFWLADNIDADFTGITLSSVQLKHAKKFAKERGLQKKIKFYKDNFFKTKFKKNSFDVIFGIESFCYSYPNPERLFREFYRLLRKGGRIIFIDGFLRRKPRNSEERKLLNELYVAWRLEGGNTSSEIKNAFRKVGFKNIGFEDKTKNIEKNILNIQIIGIIGGLVLAPLRWLGLVSDEEYEHSFAAINQKELHELGIFGYGIFHAEK